MTPGHIHVIHENPEWFPPIKAAFDAEGVAIQEILLVDGCTPLDEVPAEGVYWSRISASAHTRGHAATKEYARAMLGWLESHGRRVVNGARVLELEVSKVAQHALLRQNGFDVPRTTAVYGTTNLLESAQRFDAPFITKHNQGGKGLGVRRFDSHAEFEGYLASADYEPPVDGVTLIQEFLPAESPFVTRAEFVGGKFLYAVKVDTSGGSFELCPAEVCAVPDEVGSAAEIFSILTEIGNDDPLIRAYEELLARTGIEIAGIEFIETTDGRRVTYDINTNTNYNPAVEASAPVSGNREIARFLSKLATSEIAVSV